ncbi:DUF4145 domain-containing protein [Vibrio navarrensis]|uniref:DUF4145 domain-containing protein n=1 Tax=Vibrio navarrensis TaxID=29495 RepID=A0AAJ4LVS3_9VIBR|nr:DUF4145 domain-containing protein [Vibrio navarrensis]
MAFSGIECHLSFKLRRVVSTFSSHNLSLYCWVLSKQIDHLKSCPKIGGHFCIRALGNDAAHAITANVSKEDAKDCLDLTEALLIYIYSLGHRFEEFELRRQKN